MPHLWIVYFYALSFHVQDHINNSVSDRMPEGCSLIFWYTAIKNGSIASSNLTVTQLPSSLISSSGNKVKSHQATMRLLSKISKKCEVFAWFVLVAELTKPRLLHFQEAKGSDAYFAERFKVKECDWIIKDIQQLCENVCSKLKRCSLENSVWVLYI